MLLMFGFALIISFWISIAGRSPTCLLSRLVNTVLSAVILGEGTGARLIFASSCWPLRETSVSMVDCMSDVTEKPPLLMYRIPVKKQSSLVWVISKMSSWVGLWSVSSFSLRVSRSLVVFVPPWGGASRRFFMQGTDRERVREKEQFKAL